MEKEIEIPNMGWLSFDCFSIEKYVFLTYQRSREPIDTRLSQMKNRPNHHRAKGVAAVETALCIPILLIAMMGTLEICSAIYLKESITVCAFEGARVGTRRYAKADDVIDRVLEALDDRQVFIPDEDGFGVRVLPADFSQLSALDPITIEIVAPTAGNSIFVFDTLFNRKITASVTMVREFDE